MTPTRTDWDTLAKYYALMWNISQSPLLGNYSPFQLVFNRNPNSPDPLFGETQPIYNDDDIALTTRYRFQLANEQAQALLKKMKKEQKSVLDKRAKPINFAVGDLVLITKCDRNKLDPFYQGPHQIIEIKECFEKWIAERLKYT